MKLNLFHPRLEYIKIRHSFIYLSFIVAFQLLLFLTITSLSFACEQSEIYYTSLKAVSCNNIDVISLEAIEAEAVLYNSAIDYQSLDALSEQPAEVLIIDGYYEVNIEEGGFYNFE
jgi:hypothetical protein